MKDCLLVMHAREIDRSLFSIKKLTIDQTWFTAFTETGLESVISKFIESSDYDNYIIVSDDVIATESALGKVRYALDERTIVSGYCNISPESMDIVNLSNKPLEKPWPARLDDYKFMLRKEADGNVEQIFRVYYAGFAFTGMRREMWLKFPFQSFHNHPRGWGSDYNLAWRLQQGKQDQYAAAGAYIEHLGGNMKLAPTLVGRVEPNVLIYKQMN